MAYMYNMKMNVMLICLLYGLRVQYEDECYHVDMSVVWLTYLVNTRYLYYTVLTSYIRCTK